MTTVHWEKLAGKGYLASGIDPGDRRGLKNAYIDVLQKMALEEVLSLKGDETVLDFGCGSGRIAYWLAPRVGRVLGLEITREMIELAESHRPARNVEFVLYDGNDFPAFSFPFDMVFSVGVLQTVPKELRARTVSHLAHYLRKGGKCFFIEQASGNPGIARPAVKDYLQDFEAANLECFNHYAIRKGRWWLLYLIRYGIIPKSLFTKIARHEISQCRNHPATSYYKDFLFILGKP